MPERKEQVPERFGIGRLFYLTSEAIVAADLDAGQVLLWNPAAERLFGYTSTEAIGMRLELLVPQELRHQHLAGIDHYRAGRAPVLVGLGPTVVPAVTKTGRGIDIALSLTDVSPDSARRVVLAVIRDVTDQLRAERELASANATLREFVATASHDLRSPLSAVLGFARVLVDAGDSITDTRRTEMLAAIARGAHQASRLVEDLLTLSQIHAGATTVVLQTVAVAAVAETSNTQSGAQAAVAVDPALHVRCDPDHLERILVNYLSNAARHGTPPIRVSAERRGETIEVRVSDRGPGVPAEFADRLFTSFARADPTAKNSTGLGLSIVKGLAEANGGRVFYELHPQHGPSFAVQLPAAVPDHPESAEPPASS